MQDYNTVRSDYIAIRFGFCDYSNKNSGSYTESSLILLYKTQYYTII